MMSGDPFNAFALPARYNASRLLWDNLAERADRPAYYCDDGVWTYRTLAQEAARIGNALLALGAVPGDRVMMVMADVPRYPAAIMGAMRAGLVPILINTLSPPDLLRFYLEDSAATVAVLSPAFHSLFDRDFRAGTALKAVLVDGDAVLPGQTDWSVVRDASAELAEAPTGPADMAFWMYSSGSTGRPKGVIHSHGDAIYTAETYGRHILKIGPDDICFSVPKVFFAYGFGNSVTFPMAVGAAAVLYSGRPDPAAIFQQIAKHRPTMLFGLPTLYTALMRHADAEGADLSSVRLCLSAAEVLSAEISEAWAARFGLNIVEGLGSTEMLHIYLSNTEEDRRVGSAGKVVPGYRVKLVKPDGSEAGDDEEGVLWAQGHSALAGYWNRPDKTSETLRDGWVQTGDRFLRDADGFHYFRGRADDLVKVSGQWVYPLEIELALNEHPKVHEACVLAMEMPDRRMTIRAWIAPRDGLDGDAALEKELQDYAKATLLPHKYPRRIVFLNALPKTGTGKIDRAGLRMLAEKSEGDGG